ncbi:hypothetical protein O181_091381 [Austropuccinia psidii MF-1]|uniref:Uncharacterized protein n=1 Tax=Austropuccinia psidii MF-1 TaxID=1389203 RepID=A0A9Q3IXB7_9BASI|nr:hypothetical protein [Austropuccinia psidii MF-1]
MEVARWTNVGGLIPIGGRPIYYSSEVPISRINTEVEVVLNSAGHQSSTSPSQPPAKRFQSQIIPSTPRNFKPVLSTITPLSPRSALDSTVRPSPMVNSQQLQPVASSSRQREDHSPFPFPATKVYQQREGWPIWVNREDPNMESEGQVF